MRRLVLPPCIKCSVQIHFDLTTVQLALTRIAWNVVGPDVQLYKRKSRSVSLVRKIDASYWILPAHHQFHVQDSSRQKSHTFCYSFLQGLCDVWYSSHSRTSTLERNSSPTTTPSCIKWSTLEDTEMGLVLLSQMKKRDVHIHKNISIYFCICTACIGLKHKIQKSETNKCICTVL